MLEQLANFPNFYAIFCAEAHSEKVQKGQLKAWAQFPDILYKNIFPQFSPKALNGLKSPPALSLNTQKINKKEKTSSAITLNNMDVHYLKYLYKELNLEMNFPLSNKQEKLFTKITEHNFKILWKQFKSEKDYKINQRQKIEIIKSIFLSYIDKNINNKNPFHSNRPLNTETEENLESPPFTLEAFKAYSNNISLRKDIEEQLIHVRKKVNNQFIVNIVAYSALFGLTLWSTVQLAFPIAFISAYGGLVIGIFSLMHLTEFFKQRDHMKLLETFVENGNHAHFDLERINKCMQVIFEKHQYITAFILCGTLLSGFLCALNFHMMLTIVSCAFAFAFFLQKKHTSHLNKSYQEIFGSINTTTATVHRVSETVTQLSRCTQNTAKCAIESTRQVTTAVIQSAKKATTAVIETSKQTVSSIYEEYQTGRLRISFESLAIGSLLLFLFVGFLYIGTIISEKRIFSSASS